MLNITKESCILHLLVFEELRCELQTIDKSAKPPMKEYSKDWRLKNATCIGHSMAPSRRFDHKLPTVDFSIKNNKYEVGHF